MRNLSINLPLLFLLTALFAAGCASNSVPKEPPQPQNIEVDQAIADLSEARRLGAVWMIRDPQEAPGRRPDLVSLDDLMARAIRLRDDNRSDAASQLARTISRFARLGIQQALSQLDAGPVYPR